MSYYQQPGYSPGYPPAAYPPSVYMTPPPIHGAGSGYGGMLPMPSAPPMYSPRPQQPPMPAPADVPPGCPPSLVYLAHLDGLVIQQEIEPLEILLGIETANSYRLLNRMGQRVYYAMEESDSCARQCDGPRRSFAMHVVDNMGVEVIRCVRPCVCCCCYCSCCACNTIQVESTPGNIVAYVKQQANCCDADLTVLDAAGMPALLIRGPGCCDCNIDKVFQVFDMAFTPIGEIRKMFSGFFQEAFTDADNFGVSFPPTLPVEMKAALIGATFLIDFMYFESRPNESPHDRL